MGIPNTVVAQRFLLQDSKGVVRAVLGVNDQGEAMLALFDARGQGRADISVTAEGLPRVELSDSAGNTRALVNVDEQDIPSIALYDGATARLVLTVPQDGPFLTLADEASRRQVTLRGGKGAAEALFEDASNAGALAIGVHEDRSVGLMIAGPAATPRLVLVLRGDGHAGLGFIDANGNETSIPPEEPQAPQS
jgi:hypothetical protein